MQKKEDRKLRVAQVAKKLDVSDKTIYRWLDEGKVFPPEKIVYINKSPRILESEVNRVLSGAAGA